MAYERVCDSMGSHVAKHGREKGKTRKLLGKSAAETRGAGRSAGRGVAPSLPFFSLMRFFLLRKNSFGPKSWKKGRKMDSRLTGELGGKMAEKRKESPENR